MCEYFQIKKLEINQITCFLISYNRLFYLIPSNPFKVFNYLNNKNKQKWFGPSNVQDMVTALDSGYAFIMKLVSSPFNKS